MNISGLFSYFLLFRSPKFGIIIFLSTIIFPQFLSMSIEIEYSCGQVQHYPKDELRNFEYFEALFCSGMMDAEKLGIFSFFFNLKVDILTKDR